MCSSDLRLAGTADLIGMWDGELSIIDYKTSAKYKHEDWIQGYFYQSTLYAMMVHELTKAKLSPKWIVVVITGDDVVEAQVFRKPVSQYLEETINLVKEYNAGNHRN